MRCLIVIFSILVVALSAYANNEFDGSVHIENYEVPKMQVISVRGDAAKGLYESLKTTNAPKQILKGCYLTQGRDIGCTYDILNRDKTRSSYLCIMKLTTGGVFDYAGPGAGVLCDDTRDVGPGGAGGVSN